MAEAATSLMTDPQPAAGTQPQGTTDPTKQPGADPNAKPEGTSLLTDPTPDTKPEPGAEPKGEEPVVPETYEFKMPEGMRLDADATKELSDVAKELKLTQEQAQRFADIGVKMRQREAEQFKATVTEWVDTVRKDKDIGGDKLAASVALANKVAALGNHPLLVKWAVAIGSKLSEDTFEAGNEAPAKGNTEDALAQRMYPTMTKR
jgi:hypothetical protein